MTYVIDRGRPLTGFQPGAGGARGMRSRPGPNFGPTLPSVRPYTGVFREPVRDRSDDFPGPINGLGGHYVGAVAPGAD